MNEQLFFDNVLLRSEEGDKMGIITKFTLKSIREKKFRTFLILLAITLSVALTFASISLKDSITDTFVENIKKYYGTADIMIRAEENTTSSLVRIKPLGEYEHLFDYQIGTIDTVGSYKKDNQSQTTSIRVRGYEQDDLDILNVVNLQESLSMNFSGKIMYVSESAAKSNDWELGDTVEITIEGKRHKILIAGIGENKGALDYQNGSAYVVMPTSTLQKIFQMQGKYTFILAKTSENVTVEEGIKALQETYKRYDIEEPIPWDEISASLNNIVVPFMFMLLLVLGTAVFIIYTAFKVIVTEKLPVLGTFRSIGATKLTTDFILIMESLFYGLLGSLFGVFLGKLVLDLMSSIMTGNLMGSSNASTDVAFQYYIIAASFGVFLSVASSLVPIRQVSKISVRDIVLGTFQKTKERKLLVLIIASLLIIISLGIPFYVKGPSALLLNGLATIFLCVGLIMMIPFITDFIVTVLAKPLYKLFGSLGYLAVKNIKGNKNIINNISLLSLGIAGILLINTLSYSITTEVLNIFGDFKYDVTMYTDGANRSMLGRIVSMSDVDDAYGIYEASAEIEGTDVKLNNIIGVDGMNYFEYFQMDFDTDSELIEKYLGNSRVIVLNNTFRDKLNIEVGDTIDLIFQDETTRPYMVIGFCNTLMNNGNYAVATDKYIKRDTGLTSYSSILIKTDKADAVKVQLEEKFKKQWHYVITTDEMEKMNKQANDSIMGGLTSFSVIAMFIGVFGILNNFVVSLMARSRSIAVMKSVGMSRAQTVKLLSLEALISGMIGGVMGIVGSIALTIQIGFILKLINIPISLSLIPSILLSGFIAGTIISVISNILPAIRTSKQSIVEAIKFE